MELLQIIHVNRVLAFSVSVPSDGKDQALVVVRDDGRVSDCYSTLRIRQPSPKETSTSTEQKAKEAKKKKKSRKETRQITRRDETS